MRYQFLSGLLTNRIYWRFARSYLVNIDRSVENFFSPDNKTQCPGGARIQTFRPAFDSQQYEWLLLVTIAQAVFHGVKAFLRTINYLTIAAFVSFWANTSIPFVCKSSLTSPIVLTRSLSTSVLTSVVREVERKNMQMRGANGYDNLKLQLKCNL